jgi:ribosome-binding protein aMBF1 (putative translation factor)
MNEDAPDIEYGNAVKAARKTAGMRTQKELADVLGVSAKMVQHYEAGRYLTPETRAKLEKVLREYLAPGDPVEAAIERSRLTPDRQSFVIGTYRQALRLQDAEEATG